VTVVTAAVTVVIIAVVTVTAIPAMPARAAVASSLLRRGAQVIGGVEAAGQGYAEDGKREDIEGGSHRSSG
jgi:hypothetical protein